MRDSYKKILSLIMCCLLVFSLFVTAEKFLMKKSSYVKNADFYNNKENYDVLFLGSSHMIMGISPMELWNDYGIVSYNLGNYNQTIPVDYWVLKNALDYTSPKLVVIDIYTIFLDEKYQENRIFRLHEMFDTMPLSKNKVSAVYDLVPEGERMGLLFPFSLYHTRWSEINSTFWDKAYPSTEKGANLDCSCLDYADGLNYAPVIEVTPPEIINRNEANVKETTAKEYLRKIIELCQDKNMDILLTALPFSPTREQQEWINSAQVIADKYSINFLNFNEECTFINYNTDFMDSGHLNSSGARKTTNFLGAYISDNYDLIDRRNGSIASDWNQDYADYEDYKLEWIKYQTSLDSYLMLLADKNLDMIIEIYNTDIWKVAAYACLFENLGIDISMVTKDTDCIVIQEGGEHVDILNNFCHSEGSYETAIGQLRLSDCEEEYNNDNSTEMYSVYLNDIEQYVVTADEDVDIRILVLNSDTLEIDDYVTFSFTVDNQINYELTTNAVNR